MSDDPLDNTENEDQPLGVPAEKVDEADEAPLPGTPGVGEPEPPSSG